MGRVCIIGAGPSGLTAAKNLQEAGIPFDCFESQSGVGGIWDAGRPGSRVHETTRMISSKRLTEFVGFRMPRAFPQFPTHTQALEYLQAYADHFDLTSRITFNARVSALAPAERLPAGSAPAEPGSSWLVSLEGEAEPRSYDGVIVASGHHHQPLLPSWFGEFDGELMHAADFQSAAICKDRRVLVVGAGNTGCDIAVAASRVARSVSISLRRGYHIFPRFMFGAPIDRCGETVAAWGLPAWLNRLIVRVCLRVAVGPMAYYGWPRPEHDVFESHPIVNSQLITCLGDQTVTVRPDVKALDGQQVLFTDDQREEFDIVICATGYRVAFPFADYLRPEEDALKGYFLNIFHPKFRNVFFVGLLQPNGAIWQLSDYQAQLIAQYWRSSGPQVAWFDRLIQQAPAVGSRYASTSIPTERQALSVDYYAYKTKLKRLIAKFESFKLDRGMH